MGDAVSGDAVLPPAGWPATLTAIPTQVFAVTVRNMQFKPEDHPRDPAQDEDHAGMPPVPVLREPTRVAAAVATRVPLSTLVHIRSLVVEGLDTYLRKVQDEAAEPRWRLRLSQEPLPTSVLSIPIRLRRLPAPATPPKLPGVAAVDEAWEAALSATRRAVILGRAGSGQTFLLRQIAAQKAHAALTKLRDGGSSLDDVEIPLLCEQQDLIEVILAPAPGPKLAAYWSAKYKPSVHEEAAFAALADWLGPRLAEPQCWLLLDALDRREAPSSPNSVRICTSRTGAATLCRPAAWQTMIGR